MASHKDTKALHTFQADCPSASSKQTKLDKLFRRPCTQHSTNHAARVRIERIYEPSFFWEVAEKLTAFIS